MIPRVTTENPTGIATFDHTPVVHLPEYAEASKALDALSQASRRAGDELEQARWLEVVCEMSAALPFADACVECSGPVPIPAPYAAVVADGRLDARYRCPSCGFTWSRAHELKLPEFAE
jgi:hypothetical protein